MSDIRVFLVGRNKPLAERMEQGDNLGSGELDDGLLQAFATDIRTPGKIRLIVVVNEGLIESIASNRPGADFDVDICDLDTFEGNCAGGTDGECSPDEHRLERKMHARLRALHKEADELPHDIY